MWRSMGWFLTAVALLLALFALWYVIKSRLNIGLKILWIILIFIPFVGAIAYFLIYGTGAPASDLSAHEDPGLEEQRFGK